MSVVSAAAQTGFTAEEMAELSAGDSGASPEPAVSEEPATAEPDKAVDDTAVVAPGATPKPSAQIKPPPGNVPLAALHEARRETQELRDKLSRMEGAFTHFAKQSQQAPAQTQAPDENDDPLGFLKHQLAETQRQLTEMSGASKTQREQSDRERAANQVLERYASATRAYAKDVPDFNSAYQFLADARDKELAALGYEDPVERTNMLQYEEGTIIYEAFRKGKNPAELLYNAAKLRGFAVPAAVVASDSKLDRLKKGQAASASLGNGAAEPAGDSLERLSELYEEDPPEADKMFNRMKRSGKLG